MLRSNTRPVPDAQAAEPSATAPRGDGELVDA